MKKNDFVIKKNFLSTAIFIFLILLAPLFIFYFINKYGITVPFMDHWGQVPLHTKLHDGELLISEIWKQHNVHRIFFPRLIMLLLAYLTEWNIIYELYTIFVLAGLLLLFLYFLLRKSSVDYFMPWLLIPFSLLVFSPIQYANWTFGIQIVVFLSVLTTVVSVWSVCNWPGELKGVLIAIAAAVVSSYSFNNGLITWVVVGIILILQKKRKPYFILIWFASFILTASFYYYDYRQTSHLSNVWLFINEPINLTGYILAYLGSPLGFRNLPVSIALGAFLVIAFCIGVLKVWFISRDDFQRLLPWLAISLYVLLTAAVTGMGRLGIRGVSQALTSRYTTVSTLFALSLLAILAIWLSTYLKRKEKLPRRNIIIISFVSGVFFFSYLLSFSKGITGFEVRTRGVRYSRACLDYVETASDKCLRAFHPEPELVRKRIKSLREIGYFNIPDWKNVESLDNGRVKIDFVNNKKYSAYAEKIVFQKSEKNVLVRGHVFADKGEFSENRIYLVFNKYSQEIVIPAARSDRRNITRKFGYIKSGWSVITSVDNFDYGCYSLTIRVLGKKGRKYRYSKPEKEFCFNSTG